METDNKYLPVKCAKCGAVGTIVQMKKCCIINRMINEEFDNAKKSKTDPGIFV